MQFKVQFFQLFSHNIDDFPGAKTDYHFNQLSNSDDCLPMSGTLFGLVYFPYKHLSMPWAVERTLWKSGRGGQNTSSCNRLVRHRTGDASLLMFFQFIFMPTLSFRLSFALVLVALAVAVAVAVSVLFSSCCFSFSVSAKVSFQFCAIKLSYLPLSVLGLFPCLFSVT